MSLRVRRPFSVGKKVYKRGDVVSEDHPIVAGREHLFAPVQVERATAAPGEVRNVSRHVCDECGFVSSSAAGLASHKRSHDG